MKVKTHTEDLRYIFDMAGNLIYDHIMKALLGEEELVLNDNALYCKPYDYVTIDSHRPQSVTQYTQVDFVKGFGKVKVY